MFFRDFCPKQGIDCILCALKQGSDIINLCLKEGIFSWTINSLLVVIQTKLQQFFFLTRSFNIDFRWLWYWYRAYEIPLTTQQESHTTCNCNFWLRKRKHVQCFYWSSYRNTSGSLGEQEMLWEHEPQASVSTSFSNFRKLWRVSL